jgi:hypothetical protein
VIDLGGGLVVPTAPTAAAVDADDGALVAAQHHAVAVGGVDPELVVVVAAGRALDRGEVAAVVGGFVGGGIDDVGLVRVGGIDRDGLEVPAAAPQAVFVVHLAPDGASVVGDVDAAEFAAVGEIVDHGPDAVGIAGRDGDADLADGVVGGQAAGEAGPGVAAVGGLIQAAAGHVGGGVDVPGRAARGPERDVKGARVVRIEADVDGAGVGAAIEDFGPVRAAVGGAVEAAVGAGDVDAAEGGDVDAVGIGGIDGDAADAVSWAQADELPGAAGVGGLVHAAAVGGLRAGIGLAGADVDDVGIGGRDGDGADGLHRFMVEDGAPGAAGVVGLPHAAADRAHVEGVGLAGVAGHGEGAAAAHGADVAPHQAAAAAEQRLRHRRRLGERGGGEQGEREGGERQAAMGHAVTSDTRVRVAPAGNRGGRGRAGNSATGG